MNETLRERLLLLAAAALGRAATDEDEVLVQEAIGNHLVEDRTPPWMIELLDRLLEARPTPEATRYPWGYPEGENGLVNILADMEAALGPLGIDDCGEQWSWALPALGVRLIVSREGPGDFVVRPWSGHFAEGHGDRVEEGLLVDGLFVAPRTMSSRDGRLLWTIDVDEGLG
jgi:hypothetical protein